MKRAAVVMLLLVGFAGCGRPATPAPTAAEVACRHVVENGHTKVKELVGRQLDEEGLEAREGLARLDLMTKDYRAYQRQEALSKFRSELRQIDHEAEIARVLDVEWQAWKECLAEHGTDLQSVKPESLTQRGRRLGVIPEVRRRIE